MELAISDIRKRFGSVDALRGTDFTVEAGEKKYQMIVTDSQWMGDFVEGGHYLKLNKYIDADPELKATLDDMHQVLKDTSSSYPYKSTNYYGFPQFPDNLVTAFRKDLFCNATERANYRKQFSKSLSEEIMRDYIAFST